MVVVVLITIFTTEDSVFFGIHPTLGLEQKYSYENELFLVILF